VDQQGLAVLAEDDVARLDVAMEHATRMGVVDGIADVEEAAEEFAQGERGHVGAPSDRGGAPSWSPGFSRSGDRLKAGLQQWPVSHPSGIVFARPLTRRSGTLCLLTSILRCHLVDWLTTNRSGKIILNDIISPRLRRPSSVE
jgi:hypothetical protein